MRLVSSCLNLHPYIAARIMRATWHHDGPVLSICFAYTGREDIAQAIGVVGTGVARGALRRNDVSEDLLEKCLHGDVWEPAAPRGWAVQA